MAHGPNRYASLDPPPYTLNIYNAITMMECESIHVAKSRMYTPSWSRLNNLFLPPQGDRERAAIPGGFYGIPHVGAAYDADRIMPERSGSHPIA